MRFRNKVALITAAANGIGRATAEIMAREGATVIAVDNHQGRLDEAVPALREAGGNGGKVRAGWSTRSTRRRSRRLVAAVERDHRPHRYPGQCGRRQHGDRQARRDHRAAEPSPTGRS